MKYWIMGSLAFLQACSSISEQECKVGDWYSIGVNDGQAGKLSSEFRDYQKDCAKHGVSADFKTYLQGHQQGLVFYCDFAHGVSHGRAGNDYNTACTGKLEPAFRQGYQQGHRWYKAKHQVDEIAGAINSTEFRIVQIREEIYRINQQIAAENNPSNRAALLYRSDRLRDESNQLSSQLGRLQIQLAQAQQAFAPLDRPQ